MASSSPSKAYIGLSTPIAYGHHEKSDEATPLLEAPLGLFLLYDELWFLHRDLCPQNMRELDYVHFLYEEDPQVEEAYWWMKSMPAKEIYQAVDSPFVEGRTPWFPDSYGKIIREIAPSSVDAQASAGKIEDLSEPGFDIYPGSDYGAFELDYLLLNLIDKKLDYISNSIVRERGRIPIEKQYESIDRDLLFTERFISKHIPNLQKPCGPYFEEIDDFRQLSSIQDFRAQMRSQRTQVSPEELEEGLEYIRSSITAYETEGVNVYLSAISFFLKTVPGVGRLLSWADEATDIIQDYNRGNKYGWVNFVCNVDKTYNTPPESIDYPP